MKKTNILFCSIFLLFGFLGGNHGQAQGLPLDPIKIDHTRLTLHYQEGGQLIFPKELSKYLEVKANQWKFIKVTPLFRAKKYKIIAVSGLNRIVEDPYHDGTSSHIYLVDQNNRILDFQQKPLGYIENQYQVGSYFIISHGMHFGGSGGGSTNHMLRILEIEGNSLILRFDQTVSQEEVYQIPGTREGNLPKFKQSSNFGYFAMKTTSKNLLLFITKSEHPNFTKLKSRGKKHDFNSTTQRTYYNNLKNRSETIFIDLSPNADNSEQIREINSLLGYLDEEEEIEHAKTMEKENFDKTRENTRPMKKEVKKNLSAQKKIGGKQEAYMVIADGDKSKKKARKKLRKYNKKGAPQHDHKKEGNPQSDLYPRLFLSDHIKGLNPGFWIVVVAIAQDKKVANTLSKFLRTLDIKSYVKKVWVEEPEDLRLFIFDGFTLEFYEPELGYQPIPSEKVEKYIRGFRVAQSCEKQEYKCNRDPYRPEGKSNFNANKKAVIPFTLNKDYGDRIYSTDVSDLEFIDCYEYNNIKARKKHRAGGRHSMYIKIQDKKIIKNKNFLISCWNAEGD